VLDELLMSHKSLYEQGKYDFFGIRRLLPLPHAMVAPVYPGLLRAEDVNINRLGTQGLTPLHVASRSPGLIGCMLVWLNDDIIHYHSF
jgi:hypothetical protein